MEKHKKLPKVGEVVTATITSIQPNSAFAKLEGYHTEGMIHISEIAKGWVKDIRKHVKTGKKVAVKVIKVNPYNGHISLSLKAVADSQKSDAFKEKHLHKRAHKMLELAAKDQNKTLEQALEEVGQILEDTFGTLYKAFETAVKKPEKIEKTSLSKPWKKAIISIAEKNIKKKSFIFKADLEISSKDAQGIEKIKSVLKQIEKKKVKILYISAPKYTAIYEAKDAKKAQKSFTNILEKAEKSAKDENVQLAFKIQE